MPRHIVCGANPIGIFSFLMPEYRRAYEPGGTFFFTIVTRGRRPIFADANCIERLRGALREVNAAWPFKTVAGVILPDHMHFIWTLPPDDSDYSKRIGRMKVLFTRAMSGTPWGHLSDSRSSSRRRHRESDIWQRRFWEHVVRDQSDFENHLNYLHYNPVKHGLCECPHMWAASSFSRFVDERMYEPDWCCACHVHGKIPVPYPAELDATVGE